MPPSREHSPVGYQALIEQFAIPCLPPAHTSFVRRQGGVKVESEAGRTVRTFPTSYAPEPTVPGQLEFALKYDGVNLEVLRAVCERANTQYQAGDDCMTARKVAPAPCQ